MQRTERFLHHGTAFPTGGLRESFAVCLIFFALLLPMLHVPPILYFDEVHYAPAAIDLLQGKAVSNRQHPMFAKEVMAISMALVGDNPVGWRFGNVLTTTVGLFGFIRAIWWLSRSLYSTILFGVLLASNLLVFSLARIAMLDGVMFGCVGVATHFLVRSFHTAARVDLGVAGASLGLAVAAKWSAIPVALAYVVTYAAVNRQCLRKLQQGILFLGIVPAFTYLVTFAPGFFVRDNPLQLGELLALHLAMIDRLSLLVRENAQASSWWEWVINTRPIWNYQHANGFYRIVLIGGNPFTMLAMVPAVLYGLVAGWRRKDWELGIPASLYCALLAFWALSGKPVQYVFHYLLPSTYGTATLAIVLGRWCDRQVRWPALLSAVVSVGLFAWFYPALTGIPVREEEAARRFGWPPGWEIPDLQPVGTSRENLVRLRSTEACLEEPRSCH